MTDQTLQCSEDEWSSFKARFEQVASASIQDVAQGIKEGYVDSQRVFAYDPGASLFYSEYKGMEEILNKFGG